MEPTEREDCVKDLETWLQEMVARPVPGGVAAAAVAAAMGAALLAKAARISMERQSLAGVDRENLEAAFGLAQAQSARLMGLASADEAAYETVLDTRMLAPEASVRRQAWRTAAESPIRIAEASRTLLDSLSQVLDLCWQDVRADLLAGGWLLEASVRVCILAAENNLRAGEVGSGTGPLQDRIDALREGLS
jgi:formiminotetrahydrofolate cyclodeaminase